MNYKITKTWNGSDVDHPYVQLTLHAAESGVEVRVKAPFFNDPGNPGGEDGKPFPNLWDYEVVEAFFLNDKNQYLEVELCPHGQHIVLLLKGFRDCFADLLPMKYTSAIKGDTWEGTALIPMSYFPPKVSKFNAYAIHGSGSTRTYEALYPASKDKHTDPDFHRLEYFQQIDFQTLLPQNWASDYFSKEWEQVLK
ncbi:UPF0462 protein C4orf33 homolog [Saccostrea echinata]|uniref:UPF0462 protein C4orf33 homolog n=1 Tax=Saccostrea echinata TaxID=191078 RepID=UPI002A841742|nr:UPF0462 protein C4orf33 homolog [Saccostrea echinata]